MPSPLAWLHRVAPGYAITDPNKLTLLTPGFDLDAWSIKKRYVVLLHVQAYRYAIKHSIYVHSDHPLQSERISAKRNQRSFFIHQPFFLQSSLTRIMLRANAHQGKCFASGGCTNDDAIAFVEWFGDLDSWSTCHPTVGQTATLASNAAREVGKVRTVISLYLCKFIG